MKSIASKTLPYRKCKIVYERLIESNVDFYALDIPGLKWIEIDTKEDLANAERIFGERASLFSRINIDKVDIRTDVSYSNTLFTFFRMRERKARR